jgi:hypothetical protein
MAIIPISPALCAMALHAQARENLRDHRRWLDIEIRNAGKADKIFAELAR